MKNKIFALLLSACMCFTLCACGDGAESNEKAPAQVNPVGMTEAAKETQAAVENEIVAENEQKETVAVNNEGASDKTNVSPLVKGSSADAEGGVSCE